MKAKILLAIDGYFLIATELGNVGLIADTEDNRNPEIGPLTKLGIGEFEKKPPVFLTAEHASVLGKQIAGQVSDILNPVMERLDQLERKNSDLETDLKEVLKKLNALNGPEKMPETAKIPVS